MLWFRMSQELQHQEAIIDSALREQFEIQMRSQYKWQADNTWLYWPFILISLAFFLVGVIALVANAIGGELVFGLMFGGITTFVGGVMTVSLWSGYKTAREMAERLKQAETEGRQTSIIT